MCHHYRKIFNAKPRVDTSPPEIFQLRTNKWMHSQRTLPLSKMTNLRRIQLSAQDTHTSKRNNEPTICPYYYQHHIKDAEAMYDLNHSFVISKKPFTPTILKTNVQSKIRHLHAYHLPRKKEISTKVSSRSSQQIKRENKLKENSPSARVLNESKIKRDKMPKRATDQHSELSSEDSAYNEGECVMSNDSRGSTPQKSTQRSFSRKMIPVGNKSDARGQKTNTSHSSTKDDILCIQFLKEITNDILKKNIFTNKALRNVLNYHTQINKYNLQLELIRTEVAKLGDRLGIPKDDKFDEEDYGLGKDDVLNEKDGKEYYVNNNDNNNFTKNVTTNESIILEVNSKPDENPTSSKSTVSEDFENYSDSFSNISQSSKDRKNEEKSSLEESDDLISDSIEEDESNNDNLQEESVTSVHGSDSSQHFEKVDNDSEIESDLEIPEILPSS